MGGSLSLNVITVLYQSNQRHYTTSTAFKCPRYSVMGGYLSGITVFLDNEVAIF